MIIVVFLGPGPGEALALGPMQVVQGAHIHWQIYFLLDSRSALLNINLEPQVEPLARKLH